MYRESIVDMGLSAVCGFGHPLGCWNITQRITGATVLMLGPTADEQKQIAGGDPASVSSLNSQVLLTHREG